MQSAADACRSPRCLASAGIAIALCTFLASGSASAQAIPLRYAQTYSALRSIYSLPVLVAQKEGLFQRAGLDFQVVVPIPGGSDKMITALHDGTADVTHVATPFLIRAALAGSDAVAIAAEFNNPIYSLVAQPQMQSFADLRGQLLGFADPGGTISFSMRKLLARHGIGDGDYEVKVIEGTPARLACLKRGACAAVPLGQPDDLQAAAQNYRILGDSTEAVPQFLYTVTAARRSWAQAHRDALTRYVRALAAAFRFIRDPANRAEIVHAVVESTGCSDSIAQQTLKLYFEPERNVLPSQAELSLPGLAQVIAFMAESGAIKDPVPNPERFVDLQYLQSAGTE